MSCLNSAGAANAPATCRRLARALCLGTSLVSVSSLVWTDQAAAEVNIGGGRSTPIATATATSSGAPDDVTISSGGSINVPSGTAVTLNSSNNVSNSGSITIQNANNATGILAIGGNTGTITNAGSITINETDTTTTTDSAGNVIGPFATGSNRYGIRVIGPGALNGSVLNNAGGAITVQGNNSAAVSIEAPLTGALTDNGTITVTGANSFGIVSTPGATIGGPIAITAGITASGPGSTAISLGDNVAGGLSIQSTVTATGYHSTVRNTNSQSVLDDQNKNDAAQGGAAVSVGGDLTKGLLVSAPPLTISSTVTDANGDGIADATEASGTVTSYGSAPAIVIGATGRNIALGDVGTGQSAYGVTILGVVSGQGLRDNVSATGLQIGLPGGGGVTTGGGVTVDGTLSATSYSGNATALHLYGGASVPTLYNSGTISSTMTTTGSTTADAIVVESGASMPTIKNAGTIESIVVGQTGSAGAIIDHSGSLTRLENVGAITATVFPASGSTVPVLTPTIAVDNSLNTSGFELLQYQSPGYTNAPVITGNVLMGSGADRVDLLAGVISGDLIFGGGANILNIDNGASAAGAVTATGGTLALSIGAGSLQINSTDRLNMPSLNLGAKSSLTLTVDPANNIATELAVTGPATIASGAKIGVRLVSLLNGSATYTLVQSPQLNSGAIDTSLLGSVPYLYSANFTTSAAAGTINLTLAQKNAQQLQLPGSTGGALNAVLSGVAQDATLTTAVLSQTTRAGFLSAYNELLPNHSGNVFRMFTAGSESFGRVLDDRQNGQGGGAWMQEVNFGAVEQANDGTPGYTAWGVGLIGGYELPSTRLGIFGVNVGGFTSQARDHGADTGDDMISNVVQAGAYWRATFGAFTANANVAANYLIATNHRQVTIASNGTDLFTGTATGHWNGLGINSRFRVSYEKRLGDVIYLRPQLGVDYAQLHEDAYNEGGGGVLDLAVSGRTSSELSAFAGVAIGALFGDANASWGPELTVGYRDAFNENLGNTNARFMSGGDSFSVGPDSISGSGVVAHLALKSESTWGALAIEGGAEQRGDLTVYDLRIAAHFTF